MKVKGIGNVSKKELLSIMTKDGVQAYKDRIISDDELIKMFKMEKVKIISNIGNNQKTFEVTYDKVPDILKENGSIEEIAAVVDALYNSYDGVNKNKTND